MYQKYHFATIIKEDDRNRNLRHNNVYECYDSYMLNLLYVYLCLPLYSSWKKKLVLVHNERGLDFSVTQQEEISLQKFIILLIFPRFANACKFYIPDSKKNNMLYCLSPF